MSLFPSCNLAPALEEFFFTEIAGVVHRTPPQSAPISGCLPGLNLPPILFSHILFQYSSLQHQVLCIPVFLFFLCPFLDSHIQTPVFFPLGIIFASTSKKTQTPHEFCPRGGLGKVEEYGTLGILWNVWGVGEMHLWEEKSALFCLLALFKLMLRILVSGILECHQKPKENWKPN